MRPRKARRIEIGEHRVWKQGVWEGKTFEIIERVKTPGEDRFHTYQIMQSRQVVTVYETSIREMSELIEEP